MENWYWIELIGFDKNDIKGSVKNFLDRTGNNVKGVSLFLYSSEFVNAYSGFNPTEKLKREYCSYAAHETNGERSLQIWSYKELKALVSELQKHSIEVVFSTFSTFIYRDKKGKVIVGKYGDKHLDIRENITCKFGNFGSVSVIKRFNNGSLYGDYFISQLTRIIKDFNLDGFHLADGLSFPIKCVEIGDYSDDLIERFVKKTKISLPKKYLNKIDNDKELSFSRYRYVLENYRYEYTAFLSSCYGEFLNKAYKAFDKIGKKLIFNGAWTRDPFECLFRYGVDDKDLKIEKSNGYIFENMGASMPIFSLSESGGVPFSDEFRVSVQYFFALSLLSHKAYSPKADIINLTPIKDTFEQWNLIENNPNMLAKAIAIRNSAFIKKGNKFVKASKGAMYCLSDAVSKSSWDFLNKYEKLSDLSSVKDFCGYVFLFNDNVKKEVQDYIKTRKLNSNEIRKRLISEGLTYSGATDINGVSSLKAPLIVTELDNFNKEDLSVLENYKGDTMAVFGRKTLLKRKPDKLIKNDNSDLYCAVYNLDKRYEDTVIEGEKTKTDLSPDDEFNGLWTAKLKYENISKAFFENVYKVLNDYSNVPKTEKGARCTFLKTGKNKYRLYVYNDLYSCNIVSVSLPFKIKSAKAVINSSNLKIVSGNSLSVKLPNNGVEIIDVIKEI